MLDALKRKINQGIDYIVDELKVSDEDRNQRLEICRSCDKLGDRDFCKMCGCYMPAKTYLPHGRCPIGKWNTITVEHKKE